MQPIKVFAFVLILFGALLLLENITDLNIPVAGTLLSLTIIAIGVLLIRNQIVLPQKQSASKSHKVDGGQIYEENTVFGSSYGIASSDDVNQEYNIVFGSRTISFDPKTNQTRFIEINTVFGSTTLLIPRNLPIEIKSEVVFGDVKFPNGSNKSFGDLSYQNFDNNATNAILVMKLTVVFGNLKVFYV